MGFKADLMKRLEEAVDATLMEHFGSTGTPRAWASKPARTKAEGFTLTPQSRRIPDFAWKAAGLKSATGAKEKLIQRFGMGALIKKDGTLPPEQKGSK